MPIKRFMAAGEIVHKDLRNHNYREWRQFLENSESWTPGEISEYQLKELKRIVRHAYENTRAYRALYESNGITPDSIREIEDIRKLPFVEKETIRDHLEDFSVPMEGRTYVTTGGSTGIPCGMYRDPKSFAKELASKAHQYRRVGWREGDRQIVFRGLPINTPDRMEFVPEFNELRCSTYDFVPEQMEVFRRCALEYQPDWIRCYPSSGYVFATFLKETVRRFPAVKGILCSSEHLYDFQRALLGEVFKARVFVHYGHYEMAVLAGYCEYEETYHVLPQYGYAELIARDGHRVSQPGEIGEIVGTSFIMHTTPFIRYKTQDLAVFKGWGCSSCGRPYQIWERIEGRLQELILTKSGRYLSTSMLNMHDDFYDRIKQFQFVQREPGKIVFRFVPKNNFSEDAGQIMQRRLLARCLNDVDLTMEAVPEIPLTQRGKHRLLVQELKIKFDNPALQQALPE
jgi:phenylacetate-CoA ligase